MHVVGDETKTSGTAASLKPMPTEQVSKHRLLGVTVDKQLKWQTHISNICRTVSRNIFLLSELSYIVCHKSNLGFSVHALCRI